jgi:tetratricopeptide (TPR) repeat protein
MLSLSACDSGKHSQATGSAVNPMGFAEPYNAHALAQTYMEAGRRTEAIAEYERSLRALRNLDDDAQARMQKEFGLSEEQIQKELEAARAQQ